MAAGRQRRRSRRRGNVLSKRSRPAWLIGCWLVFAAAHETSAGDFDHTDMSLRLPAALTRFSPYGDVTGIEAAFEQGINYFYWGSKRRKGMKEAIRRLAPRRREEMVIALQTYDYTGLVFERMFHKGLRQLRIDYAEDLAYIEQNLGSIAKPTLIIWAENDKYLPVSPFGERIQQDIPGSTLVRLPDCGHFLQEEQPGQVTRLIVQFLQDSPG